MFRIIYIFLAITIFSYPSLFAQQVADSIPVQDTSIIIREYYLDPLTKQTDTVNFDTTMQEFHIYNPIYKYSFSNSFLGNSGQAFQSNDFLLRETFSPFIFEKPYSTYFHNPFNIGHFNTRKPFTQIEYVNFGSGQTSEQIIKALHTQNYNEYTNFGLLYDLIASKGIYLNQNTKANRLSFFGSYDKNAYSIFGSISLNKVVQEENGGLVDIDLFKDHPSNKPGSYTMFLNGAESTNKKNVYFITQTLDIQKNTDDTSSVKKKVESLFHINHTLSYSKYYKVYTDMSLPSDTPNIYSNYYYPENGAHDSASIQILENSFQISGDSYKFLPGFIAGIKHQFQENGTRFPFQPQIIINNIPVDRDTIIASHRSASYNNFSIFASILDKSMQRVQYEATVEYFYAGYRQNDIISDFKLRYATKNKRSSIIASANFYLTEPDFFLKSYSSSHFKWDKNLFKISNTGAKIAIDLNNGMFYADVGLNLFGNYIYFDQMALPQIADNVFILSSFHFVKKFKWRGFNQVNKLLVQKSTSEKVLQLPLLAYTNTSYYENAFFNDVLKIQIGFDFYYNTSYYADAFMPATCIFYRQDKGLVGNYPFLDPFLNWKLKRTRFFIKFPNSLSGLAGYSYFTTYGYPMNERGLRFGFSWTFYD